MRYVLTDFRHAVRGLRKAPFFTTLAVASLALGIGATAAIFTLVDQVLLRPLPVERPHELVQFQLEGAWEGDSWGAGISMSYPMYEELRESASGSGPERVGARDNSRVFSDMFTKFDWRMHIGARGQAELATGGARLGYLFPRARRAPGARAPLHAQG